MPFSIFCEVFDYLLPLFVRLYVCVCVDMRARFKSVRALCICNMIRADMIGTKMYKEEKNTYTKYFVICSFQEYVNW